MWKLLLLPPHICVSGVVFADEDDEAAASCRYSD